MPHNRSSSVSPGLSGFAAVAGLIASAACCLPTLPLFAAAGLAGSGAIFARYQPYLLVAAVACIAFGFWQARRGRGCRTQPSRLNMTLLWSSAALVTLSVLFPQLLAGLAADLIP